MTINAEYCPLVSKIIVICNVLVKIIRYKKYVITISNVLLLATEFNINIFMVIHRDLMNTKQWKRNKNPNNSLSISLF